MNSKERRKPMKFLVIPAFEPDEKLIKLLEEVSALNLFQIIVVDDGSGDKFNNIFAEAEKYAIVIAHGVNKGKGAALKTAFTYIKGLNVNGIIVTADSDGQHTVSDIIKVSNSLRIDEAAITTGVRCFTGKVPLKSKIGNTITKYIYFLVSGLFLNDTQCGLRAFSVSSIPFLLSINGDRYEYEMNMLLLAKKNGLSIKEVPIETVYIDDNSGSHFSPVKDAVKIYGEILRFTLSSIAAFATDYAAYGLLSLLFAALPTSLMLVLSNVGARLISSTLNFNINKKFVFKHSEKGKGSLIRYFSLAAGILGLNTIILLGLNTLSGGNIYLLKLIAELACFAISFTAQKLFVFKMKNEKEKKSIARLPILKKEEEPCVIRNF